MCSLSKYLQGMEPSANTTTYEFHTDLNPVIWDGAVLKPEIRDKLMDIASAFIDFIEIDIDVVDVIITGSLANYNYTVYSDFDLHILTDFSEYKADPKLLKDYFGAKKTVWNTTRNITIKDYQVELYVQDVSEAHYSTGVYSLKRNEWLVEPKPITNVTEIDKKLVLTKKQAMLDIIKYALSPECTIENAENAKEKFMSMRKIGLEKGGEFSAENLAYKELRREGWIDKLIEGVISKKDVRLSLAEEKFKNYFSLNSQEKRGPRHRSLTAGVNSMTNTKGKSVRMIAKSHTDQETPFPKIENLKAKKNGIVPLTPEEARGIAAFYDIDLEKIKTTPRGLSTSSIKIAFNPTANIFILTK